MMRTLIRRAMVAAGAIAVVLGTGAGVASAAPAPVLAWSPGSFDFGTLAPGAASAPHVFTLSNTGGSATSALTITVTPPAFTITADHCTGKSLGPGKSCTVSVTYTAPTTAGPSQATLTATSNKPAATARMTLTGMSGKATPAIATTAQPAIALAGAQIADQATVTGRSSPAGTVTFNLYGNSTCAGMPLFTDANESLANGTATSSSYTTTAAGTVYWVATYNGDSSNTSVSSGCGDEPVTISTCLLTDTTSNQTYTDLQDAVNAATAGDTLDVAGTCTGTTTIGEDLTITGSTGATLDGGGQGSVLTIDSGVTVTLNTLTITGGAGTGGPYGDGGGIYNDGGTVTLDNTTVSDNFAGFHLGAGGGIESDGGTVTLNGTSSVTGNYAVAGGGISLLNATLALNGSSSISNNTAGDDFAGGILNNGGTVTLGPGSSLTGNQGAQLGGGIDNSGTLILDGASITGNSASEGGGISNDGTVTGTATITGNTAGVDGGGIYVDQGTVTLNDSSAITGNTAGVDGGGIYNNGTVTLDGSSISITDNHPNNCSGGSPVTGCTG